MQTKRNHRPIGGSSLPCWTARLLILAGIFIAALAAAPRAHAQNPRLAVSEYIFSLVGDDNTREYIEIANLGDAPWNPNNFWVFRYSASDAQRQMFVRITGVDPIPAGQVLLLEWGRPIGAVAGTTKGNVFVTGRTGKNPSGGDIAFDGDELRPDMALAVFDPTTNNAVPALATGTMRAYIFQGTLSSLDKAASGYSRAVALNLWKDGDALPTTPVLEWGVGLRMQPGTYPANHGRRAADYFLTLSGVPALTNDGFQLTSSPAPAPNTMNRIGSPGRPNYVHSPAVPISGQLDADLFAVSAQAVPASLVANSPATGLAVAALSSKGAVGTTLLSNNQWSPFLVFNGPAADGLVLIDNPKRLSRTILVKATDKGALFGAIGLADLTTAVKDLKALNVNAKFAPVAVVDPATGNESYVIVDAANGSVMVGQNVNGTTSAFSAVAGVTTDAPVAAAWNLDLKSLVLVAWNGNQLVLNATDATGKFGTWKNVGPAVSDRPAGIAPSVAWNPATKQLEIVTVTGAADATELQHVRATLTATAVTASTAVSIATVNVSAAPAIAVNADNGQIRLLARGGGAEPALNPRDEQPGEQNGFVLVSTFSGTAWSAIQRFGTGRLPGPSPPTPLFTTPVAPVTLFDANTKRFNDLLIGEDALVYHQSVAP